jgi:hypothetical protein
MKDKAYQSLNLAHQQTDKLSIFNGDLRKQHQTMECCRMGGPYLSLFLRDCELFICTNLVSLAITPILDF